MLKYIILFSIWASGIYPSYRWYRKNTTNDKLGCAIMSIGSWGIIICWIANLIYNYFKKIDKN